jgi:hypothetical protein
MISESSEIACAEVGFLLTAKGKGNFSQNTTFNENGRHVVIQQIDRQNNEPISIEGCNLLCLNPLIAPYAGKRTLTGISILNNPEKVNITIGRGDGVPNIFKDIPEVEAYFGTNQDVKPVGSGIFVNRSNAKIVRNTFTNTGLSSGLPRMFYGVKVENYYFVPTPPILPPPINPEKYTVSVERNLFDDIQNGFFYKNFNTLDDIKVTGNEFRKIVNYPLAPPQTNTDLTKNSRAVRIQGATFRSVIAVSGNTISDSRLGIEASGLFNGTFTKNTINSNTTDANYTTFRGIAVLDPAFIDDEKSAVFEISNNTIGDGNNTWVGIYYAGLSMRVKGKIKRNTMYDVTHGIVVNGTVTMGDDDFENNSIVRIRRLPNTDAKLTNLYGSYSGIHLIKTQALKLSSNVVRTHNSLTLPPDNVVVQQPNRNNLAVNDDGGGPKAAHGLLLTSAVNTSVCSNTFSFMEHGITARGTCPITVLRFNAIWFNFFGVSVAANGKLGTQGMQGGGSIRYTYQNVWKSRGRQNLDPFGDGKRYALYSFGGSVGEDSKFFTKASNIGFFGEPGWLNPFGIEEQLLSEARPLNQSPRIIPLEANNAYVPFISCTEVERGFIEGDIDTVQIKPNHYTKTQIIDLEKIASGNILYPIEWAAPLRYTDEQLIYDAIRQKPNLRNRSAVLDSFWLTKQGTNLALLDSIGINIYGISAIPTSAGACNAACQLLRSFVPQNQIEANYKTVYIRLADWWMNNRDTLSLSQMSELKSIARQCPFTGGGAVNEAMNLLTWGGVQVLDSVDRCMDIDYTPPQLSFPKLDLNKGESESKIKLYPNPAREQVTFEYQADEIIRLAVYDVKGVLVYSTDLTGNTQPLDVSKWNKGIYLCKFTQSQGTIQTQKLIVE